MIKNNSKANLKAIRSCLQKKEGSFLFNMRILIAVLFLALFFLPIISYATQEKSGDAIVVASIADARTLIPILASDTSSSQICGYIFNGLIRYDKNLNIVGELARNWEISKDNLTITFYLRRDAFWHDGHPFTVRDVEFTYEKLIDPKTATPYSGDFLMIEKFQIIDDYAFSVTYREPFSPGLSSWSISIIPKHILEGQDLHKTDFRRNPIGTGSYKLRKWKFQEKIELIYNNNYFRGRPFISRYINRVIPDEASTFLELQTKAVDYTGIPPIAYKFMTHTKFFQKNFSKFRLSSFGYTYLGYNLENPLFNNKNVRIALDYAVNKEEIIKIIFFELAKPISGPFIIDSWAYNNDVKTREFDIKKAKQILMNAGWIDSDNDGILDKEGLKFEFTITTNQGNDQRIKTAEIIQKRLKDIGIKVKIKVLEWSVFLSECVEKRNFQAVLLGWSLSLDPDPFDIWHSSKTKEGEFNFIRYKNRKVDDLIIQGRQSFDQTKRREIYHRIHKLIFEDQPYMFLYSPDSLVIIDKRFQEIDPGPAGIGYNFNEWWVQKNNRRYRDVIQN